MSQGVGVVGLYVRDQDEALAFYTEKLGFRVHTDARNGSYRWLTVQHPDQPSFQLGLFTPGPPTIDEATAGRDSSQASDTWYGCKPQSWLSRSTARPISSSVSVNPEPPNLLSPENSRSSTCMPASSPPCSGPNGTMDSPNC